MAKVVKVDAVEAELAVGVGPRLLEHVGCERSALDAAEDGDDFEGHFRMRDELARPIWHRRILIRPDVDGWWIWQVQDHASIDGIEGSADLNVLPVRNLQPPAREPRPRP